MKSLGMKTFLYIYILCGRLSGGVWGAVCGPQWSWPRRQPLLHRVGRPPRHRQVRHEADQ